MTNKPTVTNDDIYKLIKPHLRSEYREDLSIFKFIIKYLVCRNAPQAATEAGLTRADGRFLITQPDVYKAIEKATEAAVSKYGYDAAEVVERTKEIAFFDPADLVNEDGTFIENIKEIAPEARRAIKKLKVKNFFEDDDLGIPQYKGKIIEYEFWDKPKTLELLAREKDTFKKTTVVEHDVSKNARSYLLASLDRANDAIDVTPKDIPQIEAPVAIPKPEGVK